MSRSAQAAPGSGEEAPDIHLVAPPGLEPELAAEARERGFAPARPVPGGVLVEGGLPEAIRANLELRGAVRVLLALARFRAPHLARLERGLRRIDWARWLRPDVPVRVQASCRRSRIWHEGAAAERLVRAVRAAVAAPVSVGASDPASVGLRLHILDDLVTLSLDTSGGPLHRRGFKQAVGGAPLRETTAALILRRAGWSREEPLLDPMCGSGTFLIEAAEIAAGLAPGRARPFAFELLAGFDADALAAARARPLAPPVEPPPLILGLDREGGAIAAARANAERAGVAGRIRLARAEIGALRRPPGPPGLVVVNPPWGRRLGGRGLGTLHRRLGSSLARELGGWRVALITPDAGLARATGLPLEPCGPPFPAGGVRLKLWLGVVPG
ncbi:MAG: class I SAM-dependent RNA methyltransferase [Alphaproteobacteria bacterium]|nr:MAG: class I SAM-dependent RNA methyltransferase [Alphaproteobacteria bacterium]